MKLTEVFMLGLAILVMGITIIFFGSLYVTLDFGDNFQMGMYIVWLGIAVIALGLGMMLYSLIKRKKNT